MKSTKHLDLLIYGAYPIILLNSETLPLQVSRTSKNHIQKRWLLFGAPLTWLRGFIKWGSPKLSWLLQYYFLVVYDLDDTSGKRLQFANLKLAQSK